jgi:hypothetical protein
MQLQRYKGYIEPRRDGPYRFGRSWTQPSLLMPNNSESRVEDSLPSREPFSTIDDAIKQAKTLVANLEKLGEQKHPLDIRRASSQREEVSSVREDRQSKQIKAAGRTYFLDVEKTVKGDRYLRITESRLKGKDGKSERNSIVVFLEDAREFAEAVSEMVGKL